MLPVVGKSLGGLFCILLLLPAGSADSSPGDEVDPAAMLDDVLGMVPTREDLCSATDGIDTSGVCDTDPDEVREDADREAEEREEEADRQERQTRQEAETQRDEADALVQATLDAAMAEVLALESDLLQEADNARRQAEGTLEQIDLGSAPGHSEQQTASGDHQAAPATRGFPPVIIVATTGILLAAGGALTWTWIAGSTTIASTSLSGAKGMGSRAVPMAPLFTRFQKDTVLDHPNREALYLAIRERPGVRLQDLCDATDLSRTAATHHLRLLEQQHIVVSRRQGRSRHYYENGGRYERSQKAAYAVLQNDRSRDLAGFIRDHPGSIQKALCEALGLRPSIVHWHMQRLIEAELVRSDRQGRTVSYYPTASMRDVQI